MTWMAMVYSETLMNVTEYFEQVESVLDASAHICRDLTHATNTKQNKGETAFVCVGRKTLVFR